MVESRRVIIEFRQFGSAVRVTAADPVSLIEVSFQAPASTPETTLRALAAAKLTRAIERAGGRGSADPGFPPSPQDPRLV